jgi:hypothetical protein
MKRGPATAGDMEDFTVNKFKLAGLGLLVLGAALAWIQVQPAGAGEEPTVEVQTLEEYFKVVRDDLVLRRDSALRALIQVGEDEAETFWALQKAYDEEAAKLGEKRKTLMREYWKDHNNLTAEQANDLADRSFLLDDERNALRRKYFERISADVSPIVAVQFLQLQRQFETMADLKIATYAPLAVRPD